jgi:hypothetical protein
MAAKTFNWNFKFGPRLAPTNPNRPDPNRPGCPRRKFWPQPLAPPWPRPSSASSALTATNLRVRFGAIKAPNNVIWAQEIFPIVIYSSKYMYLLCPTNSSWGPNREEGDRPRPAGIPRGNSSTAGEAAGCTHCRTPALDPPPSSGKSGNEELPPPPPPAPPPRLGKSSGWAEPARCPPAAALQRPPPGGPVALSSQIWRCRIC